MQTPAFEPNDLAVQWFVRDHCGNWSMAEKMAYIMLYLRMAGDYIAWPRQELLAADMGAKDKRTATTAVKKLEQKGALTQIKNWDPETGAQRITHYRLTAPWQAENTWDRKAWPYPLKDGVGGAKNAPGEGAKNAPGGSKNCTDPSAKNAPEAKKVKQNKEAQQEEQAVAAPAALSPLFQSLKKLVADRLTEAQVGQAVKRYGEERARFAGARVSEERATRAEEGEEPLRDPVGRFFGILKNSTDDEAQLYFEQRAAPPTAAAGDYEDPRDRILRKRQAYEDERPPDDDPLDEILRERRAQMLYGGQRPKSTDEIDGGPHSAAPAPALPKEPTPEEKAESEARKAEEARLADINRQRHVAVGRKMSQVIVETQDLPAGAHTIAVYERLLEFIDGPEYQQIGDGADPVRADYSQRLEEARARPKRAM